MCIIGRGSETIRARIFLEVERCEKSSRLKSNAFKDGWNSNTNGAAPSSPELVRGTSAYPGYSAQRPDPWRNSAGVHDMDDFLPGVAVNGNPGLEDSTPLVFGATFCRSRLNPEGTRLKSALPTKNPANGLAVGGI